MQKPKLRPQLGYVPLMLHNVVDYLKPDFEIAFDSILDEYFVADSYPVSSN